MNRIALGVATAAAIYCGYLLVVIANKEAVAQTMHPDVVWVWRLVDALEKRVDALERGTK